MVGRKVLLRVEKGKAKPGKMMLEVRDLRVTDAKGVERIKGITFCLQAGEILGVAGVAGNGQSELLEVLAGYRRATGMLKIANKEIDLDDPRADARTARGRGIAHVPEDRQHEGLIMDFMAWENTIFGYQHDPKYQSTPLFMDNAGIRTEAAAKMARFDVRPPNPLLTAKNFSGGNTTEDRPRARDRAQPRPLADRTTDTGVDIGAIEFIHQQIVALRDQGKAILLVSVELDEILSLSDRIAVMFDGQIMGERLPEETDVKDLGLLMAGIKERAA
jgi:general nucleoside transport system ATP-binding protein